MTAILERSTSATSRRARIANVLLASDLSPVSDGATDQAVDLCRSLGARLLVMNVIDVRLGLGGQLGSARASRLDQLRSEREQRLLAVVEQARVDGVEATFLVWTGEPGQSIVSAAEAEGADLVVVGTRPPDYADRLPLGSVSNHVVNHSPCPVLVCR